MFLQLDSRRDKPFDPNESGQGEALHPLCQRFKTSVMQRLGTSSPNPDAQGGVFGQGERKPYLLLLFRPPPPEGGGMPPSLGGGRKNPLCYLKHLQAGKILLVYPPPFPSASLSNHKRPASFQHRQVALGAGLHPAVRGGLVEPCDGFLFIQPAPTWPGSAAAA